MVDLAAVDTAFAALGFDEATAQCGYCIDDSNGEFMAHLPQIQHDLAHPESPKTVFGFICAALTQRRAAGVPAFTVMSCDNLPHNGAVTRKALLTFPSWS